MQPEPACRLDVDGHIATVTLRRRRLSWQALADLIDAAAEARDTPGIRAVVLTAEGDDFCHGADLADPELAEALREDGGYHLAARGARLMRAWAELPMPTLAALRGRIIGGGAGLALACDLRVAAPGATLALPEVQRGMHLAWQIIPRLVATVGLSAARWLTLSGEPMAVEALPGFARVADDPIAEARRLAARLAAASPVAVRSVKATLSRCVDLDPAADDAARFARTVAAPDFTEALTAWFERRPPRFVDPARPTPDPTRRRPVKETADLPPDARAVIEFWFGGPPRDEKAVVERQGRIWWGGGEALDAEIRERFGDLVEQAVDGGLAGWSETPRGNLARIILLDQFTRNVYRGRARAFAGDPIARRVALEAIERGDEAELLCIERMFLYMPLEHTEDLALQERCVALFERLADDAPEGIAGTVRGFGDYAVRHRDIIARFGRFPHRNPILGRAHTPEEEAYLADGGPTFGQKSADGA